MGKAGAVIIRGAYKIARRVIFKFDSERVHNMATALGRMMGEFTPARAALSSILATRDARLRQSIDSIEFNNPVGLAAGFDYDANLTQILPALDFGFGTVGTITREPYAGNAPPRLGRLVESRSLVVNKGFKNAGIEAILRKLSGKKFAIPTGLSIGRTNKPDMNLSRTIADITASFALAEASPIPFAYYELNISCPNLKSGVSLYERDNLEPLLRELDAMKLRRPLWLKMPTSLTDSETLDLLATISKSSASAVIFGNLQKNRDHPSIRQEEVTKYAQGSFSGLPARERSDELVALAYKNYRERFKIIGCGGIFNAEDAYRKIKLGASLVQLITGLIFEGPQLVAEINSALPKLLARDSFSNISEAIGRSASLV